MRRKEGTQRGRRGGREEDKERRWELADARGRGGGGGGQLGGAGAGSEDGSGDKSRRGVYGAAAQRASAVRKGRSGLPMPAVTAVN